MRGVAKTREQRKLREIYYQKKQKLRDVGSGPARKLIKELADSRSNQEACCRTFYRLARVCFVPVVE